MNVNDMVWVVMRFPFKPIKGKFIGEDCGNKLRSMVFVDNDLLSINIKNICAAQPVDPVYIATKSVKLYVSRLFTPLYRWCVVLSSMCVYCGACSTVYRSYDHMGHSSTCVNCGAYATIYRAYDRMGPLRPAS